MRKLRKISKKTFYQSISLRKIDNATFLEIKHNSMVLKFLLNTFHEEQNFFRGVKELICVIFTNCYERCVGLVKCLLY